MYEFNYFYVLKADVCRTTAEQISHNDSSLMSYLVSDKTSGKSRERFSF